MKTEHPEHAEARVATEIRESLTFSEKERLAEIRRYAEKAHRGRKHSPKEGTWLKLSVEEIKGTNKASKRTTQDPDEVYMNNVYLVQVYKIKPAGDPMLCLMVRRHDEKPIPRHWSKLQSIKEELVGDDLAIEVYPRKNRLVDVAFMYHLWVFDCTVELPFGLHFRGLVDTSLVADHEEEEVPAT